MSDPLFAAYASDSDSNDDSDFAPSTIRSAGNEVIHTDSGSSSSSSSDSDDSDSEDESSFVSSFKITSAAPKVDPSCLASATTAVGPVSGALVSIGSGGGNISTAPPGSGIGIGGASSLHRSDAGARLRPAHMGTVQRVYIAPHTDTISALSRVTSGPVSGSAASSGSSSSSSSRSRRAREASSADAGDIDNYRGSWAAYSDEVAARSAPPEITEQQKANAIEHARKAKAKATAAAIAAAATIARSGLGAAAPPIDDDEAEDAVKEVEVALEGTQFFGTEVKDYKGKSFVEYPSGFKFLGPELSCSVPSKHISTVNPSKIPVAASVPRPAGAPASARGVSGVSYFPRSGHLLLSSSLNGSATVWDTGASAFTGGSGESAGNAAAGAQRVRPLRTYAGHAAGVRQAVWSPDGTAMMTVSYDKTVKIWDTETGQVVSRHRSEKLTPNCAVFHPTNAGEILTGMMEKTILQWDTRANSVVQRYPDHQSAVNTITFIPGEDRFVSTSDDKSVLLWDYGIPVVLKQIFETELHAITSVAVHPGGNYIVGSAQNNEIVIFNIANRIKLNRKRVFKGHLSAGFACGLTFSPDGSTLVSGDAEGRLLYWDWRSGRLQRKVKAHEDVSIGLDWHPNGAHTLASCSWDGSIKFWG